MAVRASMSALISRVRSLIGDPAGASQQFDDQTVQDTLDRTRQLVRYELLTATPDIVPTGVSSPAQYNWASYVSKFTDWEADEVVQAGLKAGVNWAVLTPLTADELTGRWTFDVVLPAISTNIPAQLPPVFVTGKVYDPYLAAAFLMEMWAASTARDFDFTSDGQTFRRSQKTAAMLQMAKTFRMQAKPTMILLRRGDLQSMGTTQPVELIGDSYDFTR